MFLNLFVADTHVWLTSSDLRLNATLILKADILGLFLFQIGNRRGCLMAARF